MEYMIDRLEQELAVCENESKEMVSIPLDRLPKGVKEGDVLREQEGVYTVDEDATRDRRARMRKKMMDLFERN